MTYHILYVIFSSPYYTLLLRLQFNHKIKANIIYDAFYLLKIFI